MCLEESSKTQNDRMGLSVDGATHSKAIYSTYLLLLWRSRLVTLLYTYTTYLHDKNNIPPEPQQPVRQGNPLQFTISMCFYAIERFSCGHEDKDLIPCESFFANGICNTPQEDNIQASDQPRCAKCREAAAEEEDIQNKLQKFSIKEGLTPSATPRVRDPNAPKMYFKWCIEWQRCKRRYCLQAVNVAT